MNFSIISILVKMQFQHQKRKFPSLKRTIYAKRDNFDHKLIVFRNLNRMQSLTEMIDLLNTAMQDFKIDPKSYTGLYNLQSKDNADYSDIFIDFRSKNSWRMIKHNVQKGDEDYFIPTTTNNIQIEFPSDIIYRAKTSRKDPNKKDLSTIKIDHPLKYDLYEWICQFENYLKREGISSSSTEEIYGIQTTPYTSYITFYSEFACAGFWKYIQRFRDIVSGKVNTESRIMPPYKTEKMTIKEPPFPKIKSVVIKAPTKSDAKSINDRNEEMETSNSNRYDKNRLEREKPQNDQKKLPRKFQMKIKSKNIRKMFHLMSTGRYNINLDLDDDINESALEDE